MTIHRPNRGFTLIELLIVMLIISIVGGIALLTLSKNNHREMSYLASHIQDLLDLAEEEALLRSTTLGLLISPNAYQFLEYHPSKKEENPWHPLAFPLFAKKVIPHNITFRLKINGHIVPFHDTPDILISENGDITPFTLFIEKNKKIVYTLHYPENQIHDNKA